jgi:glycosyltransferase involved in cell wall biosynthesis
MILGLLPELGGGLGVLARMGQHTRFFEGYLRPYVRAFDEVRYFSYARETLADFTRDAELTAGVRVMSGATWHAWLSTLLLGVRYGRALSECSVLRVFQLTGALPALLARRRYGVPFVTTYGFHYGTLARTPVRAWMHRRFERLALAEADAIIVTTPELAAYVGDRVRSSQRVHVLPNAVDTLRFRPVPRLPASVATLLYVGRLSPEKNLSTLIAVAAKLRGRSEVKLRFVGDGPLRDTLAAEAAGAGVMLEIVPVVEHGRLPAIYAAADLFVLPSFTEGHAKVLIEAMSCGLPCIASNVGGNRTAIDDGRTGLLVSPRDTGSFADAIERLLLDREFARRIGAAARQEVVERYDLAAALTREIDLLVSIARQGRASAFASKGGHPGRPDHP